MFLMDSVETKNDFSGNLVMKVRRSWSNLNTDLTPAGFWIMHPDNDFEENRVAGSDYYGFWYDI